MGTEEFWEFALARYARPGVAQCCVALQDEHGANVMLLLYCAWRAQGGECVRGAALRQAMARLEPLDRHLVRPLRAARRAIRRAADALGSPALGVGADRLMQAELAAERRQAGLLADGASPLRRRARARIRRAIARRHASRAAARRLRRQGSRARGWPRWCSITEPGRRVSKRAGPHV